MYHVRQENLPFVGSAHEFVGAQQGDTSVSVFLFHGNPGSGPGPHRHPYDEIQFIREGRGVWTVSGKTFEGSAGDIFVIKALDYTQNPFPWGLFTSASCTHSPNNPFSGGQSQNGLSPVIPERTNLALSPGKAAFHGRFHLYRA